MGFKRDLYLMKKQLIEDEHLFGYKSVACNRLYLLYCFIGYYLMTEKLSKGTKYFWGGYIFSATGIMIVSCFVHFAYHDLSEDMTLSVYMAFVLTLAISMGILLPTIINSYANDMMDVLKSLDVVICDDYEEKIKSGDYKEYDRLKKKIITFTTVAWFCSFLFIFYFSVMIDVVLFPAEEKFRDFRYHLLPYYKPDAISTLNAFIGLNSFYAVAIVGIALQIIFNNWLFEYLAILIHNETIILSKYMRYISQILEEKIEKLEEIPVEKDWFKTVQRTHKSIFDEFLADFCKCIERYQSLIKCFSSIRPYFQIISSVMIVGLFLMQITNAFMVLSDNPKIVIVREAAAVALTMRSFYSLCSLGQTLENLNEMIAQEVFSIPWYRLQTSDRKIVLNFLCQVQYLLNCKIFGILPVNHNTFLGFNRLTYSYTNIMRTTQMQQE